MSVADRTSAVPKKVTFSRTVHYTREELKQYIDLFEIDAIEKITKVFGGFPCRTVKVSPLPNGLRPEVIEEFFSEAPGDVFATLAFTEDDDINTVFVSFSSRDAYKFALKQTNKKIASSSEVAKIEVQSLSHSEFLKFLKQLVLEFNFSFSIPEGERKKRFQHPDPRGTTLSEELDYFLSVLRCTLEREKTIEEERTKTLQAEDDAEMRLEELDGRPSYLKDWPMLPRAANFAPRETSKEYRSVSARGMQTSYLFFGYFVVIAVTAIGTLMLNGRLTK